VPNIFSVAPVAGVEDRIPAISKEMPARECPIETMICGISLRASLDDCRDRTVKDGFESLEAGPSN
jgi:hypothetical protein